MVLPPLKLEVDGRGDERDLTGPLPWAAFTGPESGSEPGPDLGRTGLPGPEGSLRPRPPLEESLPLFESGGGGGGNSSLTFRYAVDELSLKLAISLVTEGVMEAISAL